jgi:very-short-patch-repair endonuclease
LQRLKNDGYVFTRGKFIHGFYADFYFARGRLVVEVDGALHHGRELEDARKNQVLEANHYKVLRFTASQVLFHTNDVVSEIESWLTRRKAKPNKSKNKVHPKS